MRYGREILAVCFRILTELGRRRRSLVFWALFPAVLLVLNALILEERSGISRADAFTNALPPTLVGAALFFSCLGGSVATVVSEREQQTLKRLFLSPLSGLSYFLGIFAAHCAIGLGQTVLMYAIAWQQGASFEGSWELAGAIIVLSIVTYTGVGFLLGTQFARRTEDVNALVAAFGVPLLLLGGAFLPTSLFPDSLAKIAQFNPIYHMIAALSEVVAAGGSLADIQGHFGILIGFAISTTVLGWLAYRRMVAVEKRL